MSITINSNLATSQASLSLKRASDRLSKSLQRISSGNRIVTPSEDAGGLAVAMKLESSLRRATATMSNTQNGVSFLQMQDGALKVAGEIIDRMGELKSFYNDVSKNDEDRENYNFEFKELQKELASLKSQKFNGVSLFATSASTESGINIMTSDDGLGDPIELSRVGLFENLKSKFGADGKLNTGANGEYRQLVGEFHQDGGIYDANPGYATRDYKSGEVVYRAASTESESGYFMALRDVASGSRIKDTGNLTSNWIRVADQEGAGFSEAYPNASSYDMSNLQFNSKGEPMSYLKGDVIKVQAHWDDPNSFVFLKAVNDVPQNILIDQLLLNGIGTGKYFDFVGRDRTGDVDGKPATQFGLANSNYPSPLSMTSKDKSSLRSAIEKSEGNNFTPGYVQEGSDIFRPLLADWNLKFWSEGSGVYEPGDLIYNQGADENDENAPFLYQVSDKVRGQFIAGEYKADELVYSNGKWFKASSAGYSEQFGDTIYLRTDDLVKGSFPEDSSSLVPNAAYKDATTGDWVQIVDENDDSFPETLFVNSGTVDVELMSDLEDGLLATSLAQNSIFTVDNGDGSYSYFKFGSLPPFDEDTNDGDTFNLEGYTPSYIPATLDDLKDAGYVTSTSSVANTEDGVYSVSELVNPSEPIDGNPFWSNWDEVADPLAAASGFATDVTDDYSDLSNKDIWSKTYYGALNGISINTDYERGDNIFYQGKHYVYVSHLSSSDEAFGGEEGVNDFQQLLLNGAVRELGVYVDTVSAGGAAGKSKESFYAANQDLTFVDRLPDSGLVRTSGVERRGDPMQNGDGVFNSLDDLMYNELNPGNDGVYGTMDDFYSATPYSNVAAAAGHTDSDSDNNKDLLDTANDLGDFSVADFVDYTQSVANFRAVNGGTMSRLNYASRILEENRVNLESAHGRIMNTDVALEASKMARQNVIMQASAAMVTQANQMNQIVLQLLQ